MVNSQDIEQALEKGIPKERAVASHVTRYESDGSPCLKICDREVGRPTVDVEEMLASAEDRLDPRAFILRDGIDAELNENLRLGSGWRFSITPEAFHGSLQDEGVVTFDLDDFTEGDKPPAETNWQPPLEGIRTGVQNR